QNVSQVGNVTLSVQTPQFTNAVLRTVASDWRVSGIVSARSGSWLNVTTTQDVAGTGLTMQRPNQVSDDVYGAKTLTNYVNRAAFEAAAPGTLGNTPKNSIQGPGY